MPGWPLALARRAAAGDGQPLAGGSWRGGQVAPPTSRPLPQLTEARVTPPDGAAAPTRQPHHLAGDGLLAYLARGHGVASVR
jgi:hypothetical protein